MFISQKKSKLMLRHEAGYSVMRAQETVEKLPKTRDGQRDKVRLADVQKLVEESREPTPVVPPGEHRIRKFRPEILRQLEKLKG